MSKPKGNSIKTLLIRGGLGSLMVRVTSLALEFAVAIGLAQFLGVSEYGLYAYAYSIMRICAVPAQGGIPTLAVREVAAYKENQSWSLMKGLLFWANFVVLAFSALIGSVAAGIVVFHQNYGDLENPSLYLWAFLLLPLVALGNIRGAVLRGLGKIVLGQLPESVIRPVLFLGFALLVHTQLYALNSESAMALHAAAALAAFAVGAVLLFRLSPPELAQVRCEYEDRRWVKSALPLSIIMGTTTLLTQISILILGWFRSPTEVGEFAASVQLATVCVIPLTIVNVTVAPYVAQFFVQGNVLQLQSIATASSRVLLASVLVIFSIIVFFGEEVIAVAFGQDFVAAYQPLLVLACANLIGSLAGASMILLNMTGHERSVIKVLVATVVVSLLLNLLLIPRFGIMGAAVSMATGIVIQNLFLALAVKQRLSLSPFFLKGAGNAL